MTVQEQSWLGQQVNVVLVPSAVGSSVTLTLLLPAINPAVRRKKEPVFSPSFLRVEHSHSNQTIRTHPGK